MSLTTAQAAPRSERSLSRQLARGLSRIALALVSFLMLVPIIWMVLTSFKSQAEIAAWPPTLLPHTFLWSNYTRAWQTAPFARYFLNSAVVSVGGTLGNVTVCTLAAYAFARLRFPGRDLTFSLVLGTLMVPSQVTLVPAFLIVRYLGWINTYWALILPPLGTAFGTFLLRQFFVTIPAELEEAARIDGSGRLGILWKIIVPLAKPALATLAIFTFIGFWDDFLWPLITISDDQMRTVQLGLSIFKNEYSIDWPRLMAASTFIQVPVFIVYIAAQRYFVEGVVLSGLKG